MPGIGQRISQSGKLVLSGKGGFLPLRAQPVAPLQKWSAASTTDGTRAQTLTIPQIPGLELGDCMVAFLTCTNAGDDFTAPAGWVRYPQAPVAIGNTCVLVGFVKIADQNDLNNSTGYVFNTTNAVNRGIAGWIGAYSGVWPITPVDAMSFNGGAAGSTTLTMPNLHLTNPGEIVVYGMGATNTAGVQYPAAPPAGFTERLDLSSADSAAITANLEVADTQFVNPGDTGTFAIVQSVGAPKNALAIALAPLNQYAMPSQTRPSFVFRPGIGVVRMGPPIMVSQEAPQSPVLNPDQYINVSDSGSGSEVSAQTADLTATDAGSGIEATSNVAFTTTDAGSGADASSFPTAAIPVTDSGSGAEQTTAISFVTSDTGSGADTSAFPTAAIPVADAGAGADTSVVSLVVVDTGSGADTSAFPTVTITTTDTGSGADVSGIRFSVTDAGSGTDASSFPTATITAIDAGGATVRETFTLPDLTTMNGRAPENGPGVWSDSRGVWGILSNQLGNTDAFSNAVELIDPGHVDGTVSVDLIWHVHNQPGLVCRFADNTNYWRLEYSDSTTLALVRRRASVDTTQRSVTIPALVDGETHRLSITYVGSDLSCYFDGVFQFAITYSDSTYDGQSRVGVRANSDIVSRFDNFLAEGSVATVGIAPAGETGSGAEVTGNVGISRFEVGGADDLDVFSAPTGGLDGRTIPSGPGDPWNVLTGSWTVAGGAVSETGGGANAVAVFDTHQTEGSVSLVFTWQGNAGVAAVHKAAAGANLWRLQLQDASTIAIIRRRTNVETVAVTATIPTMTVGTVHTLRFTYIAGTLFGYLDGVMVVWVVMTSTDQTTYGATTQVGMHVATDTVTTFDSILFESSKAVVVAAMATTDTGSGADAGSVDQPASFSRTDVGSGADTSSGPNIGVSDTASVPAGTAWGSGAWGSFEWGGAVSRDVAFLTVNLSVTDAGGSTSEVSVTAEDMADAGVGTDAAALSVSITTSESGHGTDSSSLTVSFTLTDTGHGVDTSSGVGVATSDTGQGTEAGGSIAAQISPSDTGHGVDQIRDTSRMLFDAGSGTDISSLAAVSSVTDTGHGVDASSQGSVFALSDVGHGADLVALAASQTVADAGTGAEATRTGIASQDAGTGQEQTSRIALAASDSGLGGEPENLLTDDESRAETVGAFVANMAAVLAIDSAFFQAGVGSLKTVVVGNVNQGWYTGPDVRGGEIPVTPGRVYAFEAWVAGNVRVHPLIFWYAANGDFISSSGPAPQPATGVFQRVIATGVAPVGAVLARGAVYAGDGDTGTYWSDSLSFHAGSTAIPWVPGGTLDYVLAAALAVSDISSHTDDSVLTIVGRSFAIGLTGVYSPKVRLSARYAAEKALRGRYSPKLSRKGRIPSTTGGH